MIPHTRVSDEIFYASGPVVVANGATIAWLKRQAAAAGRKRARLCTHPDTADLLHEMLIVQPREAYTPPHKHPGKSESFHIIEGEMTVLVFDDFGNVVTVIEMAAADPSRAFYYRLSSPMFHTVLPRTDPVVFHEVTNGPFRRQDMILAAWAPTEADAGGAAWLADKRTQGGATESAW